VDDVEIGTLCPTGYRFLHVPRSSSRGGGVGVLFKDGLRVKTSITETYQSFEFIDVHLRSIQNIVILVVYRPPDTACALFLEEFSRLLERITAEHCGRLLITGDFNFHVDVPSNGPANQFIDILEAFNLKQHVSVGTHISGHTLDLIITKGDDHGMREIRVSDLAISDHLAVHCDLLLQKPQPMKKVVLSRKLRTVKVQSFCKDIQNSMLLQQQSEDLDSLVDQYDNVLRTLLNYHRPTKTTCYYNKAISALVYTGS
jgi:hypothetical protein